MDRVVPQSGRYSSYHASNLEIVEERNEEGERSGRSNEGRAMEALRGGKSSPRPGIESCPKADSSTTTTTACITLTISRMTDMSQSGGAQINRNYTRTQREWLPRHCCDCPSCTPVLALLLDIPIFM